MRPLIGTRQTCPFDASTVVRPEVWCDGVRPEVVATPTGTQPIAVEIAVTSFVGPEKRARFHVQGRPAVEYDLRHLRHFTWDARTQSKIK